MENWRKERVNGEILAPLYFWNNAIISTAQGL